MSTTTRAVRVPERRMPALLVLAAVALALFSVLVPIHAFQYGTPVPAAIPLGAALCAAPLLAFARPRAAVAVFCLAALALPLAVPHGQGLTWPWPWSVPAMIALIVFLPVVTILHGWRAGLVTWAVSIVGTLVMPLALPDLRSPGLAGVDLIVTASVSGATLLVAVLAVGRIRVGEELTRERELSASEQARRVLGEERTRIARELHDVVAHSTSLIQVQASTARYRIPGLPAEALAEFDEIAATARSSLAEMRRLLGVLRTEDHDPQMLPQQGIDDIPALVEGIRRVGVEVRLSFAAPPAGLSPGLQIAAFRIAQEALSNAVRHAPGAEIDLVVGVRDRSVEIRARNGPARDPVPPGAARAGHGLRGMQERAALVGGRLVVGPDPEGGWSVIALLPWHDHPEERP